MLDGAASSVGHVFMMVCETAIILFYSTVELSIHNLNYQGNIPLIVLFSAFANKNLIEQSWQYKTTILEIFSMSCIKPDES